jgi:hypothetical protein
MPAPQASAMQNFARLKFASFQITVPQDWKGPSGYPAAQQYDDAFKPDEKNTAPDTGAPPLFLPASPNKYHTDAQKMHVEKIGTFIDGICSAICSAWGTWQSTATLVGVVISGPVATAGQVVGPPWTPLILASGPKDTPSLMKYTNVVANVLGAAWLAYTATIKVPGMPWYPSFAAVPSPVGPPTPNVPVPLSALTQVTSALDPAALKSQMVGMLADPTAPFHVNLFEAIADAFDKCFKIWQPSTMVTNVLGTGPVPTFAPPFVPVGPVVGGVGTMTPGGFV